MTLRLIVLMVATFAVIGVHLPFFPVFLQHRGFDPGTIGIVLSVPLMVRIIAAPGIAFLADRLDAHRAVLIGLCVIATAAFAVFGAVTTFWSVFLVAVLFAMVWTSVIPMAESFVTAAVRSHGIDYGKIRSCGSLAFILASFAGGLGIEWYGNIAAYWVILGAVALTIPAALLLPRPDRTAGRPGAPLSLSDATWLVRQPAFLLLVTTATLIQASHALLYSFGSLHWQAAGISPTLIGLLWAIGTGTEILLFSFASWPLRRIGAVNLILIGGGVAVVRWVVTSFDPPAGALMAIQMLHALSFGATHLGSIYLMANAVPQRLGATAQGLYAAIVGGVGLGGATLAAGPLYAVLGGHGFLVMAGLSAAGFLIGLRLARTWDGRPMLEDREVSPKETGPPA
jgi:PPP family 3-phenylpropionic acid transporter